MKNQEATKKYLERINSADFRKEVLELFKVIFKTNKYNKLVARKLKWSRDVKERNSHEPILVLPNKEGKRYIRKVEPTDPLFNKWLKQPLDEFILDIIMCDEKAKKNWDKNTISNEHLMIEVYNILNFGYTTFKDTQVKADFKVMKETLSFFFRKCIMIKNTNFDFMTKTNLKYVTNNYDAMLDDAYVTVFTTPKFLKGSNVKPDLYESIEPVVLDKNFKVVHNSKTAEYVKHVNDEYGIELYIKTMIPASLFSKKDLKRFRNAGIILVGDITDKSTYFITDTEFGKDAASRVEIIRNNSVFNINKYKSVLNTNVPKEVYLTLRSMQRCHIETINSIYHDRLFKAKANISFDRSFIGEPEVKHKKLSMNSIKQRKGKYVKF